MNYFVVFIIGIVLARLLSPYEYGLFAIVSIFTLLSEPFINSGFSQALIRKQDCSNTDFSTVFYFNLFIGVLFYALLYISSPSISLFFKEPQLQRMIRVIGLIVIIDSITLIQTTILTKTMNFKVLAISSNTSAILSGLLGISLAYKGFGVWSLVYRVIAFHSIKSSFLWVCNKWTPDKVFSITKLKELFSFGSKLLASGILESIYLNIYNIIVGKFFSAKDLGLFSRATIFKDLASVRLTEAISGVSFSALSIIQNDPEKLKRNYKIILNSTLFIIFSLLFALSATAESLVLTLIGEKWRGSIIYLQLISFAGIFYPMQSMARSLLLVNGKSGLYFKLQIFSKLLSIPVILIGIFLGIKNMIVAMILVGFIEYIFKAHYSGKLIGYSLLNQMKDLIPSFLVALCIFSVLYVFEYITVLPPIKTLIFQSLLGLTLFIGLSEIFRINEYIFIKCTIIEKIKSLNNKRK